MPQNVSISVEVTEGEAELLYNTSRRILPCPQCKKPLKAELNFCAQGQQIVYDSVVLKCPPCGIYIP